MNKSIIIGRLTKDVELRFTQSGTAVGNFTVAIDRDFKNSNGEYDTDFIPVVTFNRLAENCANHIGKGRLVAVCGRIQVRTWENKQGERRYKTEIVADEVKFLDWPKEDEFLPEFEGIGGTPF